MVMDESVCFFRLRWTCADEMESSDPIVGENPEAILVTHPRLSLDQKGLYLLLNLQVLIRRGPNPAEQTGPVRHVVLGTAAVLTSASHRTRSPQEHASEQTRCQEDQIGRAHV